MERGFILIYSFNILLFVITVFLCIVNIKYLSIKYLYFSSDPESMKDDTSVGVLNAAKETLLQGLSEENQGLQ